MWYRYGAVDLHLGMAPWEDEPLPGHNRFYANDPFGNRFEFVEPTPAGRGDDGGLSSLSEQAGEGE